MPFDPNAILEIHEVIGPSDQGRSRPYKCRASDGSIYYVKGQQTNRRSLWCEWIAAHLARSLGLELPPFAILQLDEALLQELPREWREIGCMPAFGSRLHPSSTWLEPSLVDQVPIETQRAVLAFDWWIKNGDRLKGNSNLLWDASAKRLVIIDHNLAFDPDLSHEEFTENHIFADQWPLLSADLMDLAEHLRRLSAALPEAQIACDNAPPEWHWENSELDVRCKFDLATVMTTLARCATLEQWRTV